MLFFSTPFSAVGHCQHISLRSISYDGLFFLAPVSGFFHQTWSPVPPLTSPLKFSQLAKLFRFASVISRCDKECLYAREIAYYFFFRSGPLFPPPPRKSTLPGLSNVATDHKPSRLYPPSFFCFFFLSGPPHAYSWKRSEYAVLVLFPVNVPLFFSTVFRDARSLCEFLEISLTAFGSSHLIWQPCARP